MSKYNQTLLFNRSSFEHLLSMEDYITAVELAHSLHAGKKIIETNMVHADAPNGEYHIKTGGILGDNAYYGLKANGGFFNNKKNHGLPNILGIIYLSDATTAYPLAVFESSLISKMRTAAATAIAAKHLKPKTPIHLAVIGYGNQADAHIQALMSVCDIESITIAGRNEEKAENFAKVISNKINIPCAHSNIQQACENSNMIVTCTPSTAPLIQKDWIQKGTFIGAIGTDSPGKMELDANIMPSAKIVADIKSQIIKVGESQHAIKEGLIKSDDIYCELGDLITGKAKGRTSDGEIFVYDSTGTALQDVATAAYIYEKLKDDDSIQGINLFG
jgi:ornithine cyclodeaminase/alanine dehydrogenase